MLLSWSVMGTETGQLAFMLVALVLSLLASVLSGVAFLRVGSLDTEVRKRHRFVTDEIAGRLRRGLEELRGRVVRSKQRLYEPRKDASEQLGDALDGVSRELAAIDDELTRMLRRAETHLSSSAAAVEDGLSRRLCRVEAGIHVLLARAAIRQADRLADNGRFIEAEDLLDDAVAKVREAQARLPDPTAHEQAFARVIEALRKTIRAVRARAHQAKRDIESVLYASDSLLASLSLQEHAIA